MPERKPNDHNRMKVGVDLIEQDPSHTEIGRRPGITGSRIERSAAAHGLSEPKTFAATRRDARPLTQRQSRMLAFIRDFTVRNSYPPTVREIAGGCDISSTSVVDYNLRHLEKQDCLTRVPGLSRSIVLTERGKSEAAS